MLDERDSIISDSEVELRMLMRQLNVEKNEEKSSDNGDENELSERYLQNDVDENNINVTTRTMAGCDQYLIGA